MALTQPYSPHTPRTMRTAQGEIAVPERMPLEEFRQLEWDEKEHWELIHEAPCMTPSGVPDHQHLSATLVFYLMDLLDKKSWYVVQDCDVLFGAQESYLRPDISVFADTDMKDTSHVPVTVTPALVIEILSPSTASNDLGPKRDIYAASGVAEYWVADPVTGSLMIFERRQDGAYRQIGADAQGRVRSPMLDKTFRISRDGHSYKIVE